MGRFIIPSALEAQAAGDVIARARRPHLIEVWVDFESGDRIFSQHYDECGPFVTRMSSDDLREAWKAMARIDALCRRRYGRGPGSRYCASCGRLEAWPICERSCSKCPARYEPLKG